VIAYYSMGELNPKGSGRPTSVKLRGDEGSITEACGYNLSEGRRSRKLWAGKKKSSKREQVGAGRSRAEHACAIPTRVWSPWALFCSRSSPEAEDATPLARARRRRIRRSRIQLTRPAPSVGSVTGPGNTLLDKASGPPRRPGPARASRLAARAAGRASGKSPACSRSPGTRDFARSPCEVPPTGASLLGHVALSLAEWIHVEDFPLGLVGGCPVLSGHVFAAAESRSVAKNGPVAAWARLAQAHLVGPRLPKHIWLARPNVLGRVLPELRRARFSPHVRDSATATLPRSAAGHLPSPSGKSSTWIHSASDATCPSKLAPVGGTSEVPTDSKNEPLETFGRRLAYLWYVLIRPLALNFACMGEPSASPWRTSTVYYTITRAYKWCEYTEKIKNV